MCGGGCLIKASSLCTFRDYRTIRQNAVLLDVRTKSEYKEGHIPGSTNIPLDEIQNVEDIIKDHDAEIYVYCLRGSRSISAVKKLKTFGYKRARSIGGIASYKGLTVLD